MNSDVPQADHSSVVVAPAPKPPPVVSCNNKKFTTSAFLPQQALGLDSRYAHHLLELMQRCRAALTEQEASARRPTY